MASGLWQMGLLMKLILRTGERAFDLSGQYLWQKDKTIQNVLSHSDHLCLGYYVNALTLRLKFLMHWPFVWKKHQVGYHSCNVFLGKVGYLFEQSAIFYTVYWFLWCCMYYNVICTVFFVQHLKSWPSLTFNYFNTFIFTCPVVDLLLQMYRVLNLTCSHLDYA